MENGVIVATNQAQEWLLPWWWDHFSRHSSLPVCFFDLGMSKDARKWCKSKGMVMQLPAPPSQTHPWFQKPICCEKSPFFKTLWIDLDCEIVGSLEEAFELLDSPAQISLAHESFPLPHIPYPTYNSGVVAFLKDSPIIQEWAFLTPHIGHLYRGDQDLLSAILFKKSLWMYPLPARLNWSHQHKATPDEIKIIHWHGPLGKEFILRKMKKEYPGSHHEKSVRN